MEKSYVSLECARCPACDKEHETGTILLDRRMLNSMERHAVTQNRPCPECAKEGYVLLIEAEMRGKAYAGETPEIWRTGATAHVKIDAWSKLFNVPLPKNNWTFCDNGTIAKLREIGGEQQ